MKKLMFLEVSSQTTQHLSSVSPMIFHHFPASSSFFLVSAMFQPCLSHIFLGFSYEFPTFSLGQKTFMPFCSVLPYRAAVLADETASAEVVHGFASAVANWCFGTWIFFIYWEWECPFFNGKIHYKYGKSPFLMGKSTTPI